jgi:succinyl-diaminopimelate desuccinylase
MCGVELRRRTRSSLRLVRVNDTAEIDLDAVVEFARTLVRTPSVNSEDGPKESLVAELIATKMRSFGWSPLVEEVEPGRPNVVAVLEGDRAGPSLMFEGHTDVVTEGNPSQWTRDPFGGDIVGGRLYGRGSADMKGGLAALLYGVDAATRTRSWRGRIVVGALVDEEGMMAGVKDFVARGHADGIDAAIICEPVGGEIVVAHKGAIRMRVDFRGRMAHGAMPERGINPLTALGQFTARMVSLEDELKHAAGTHQYLGSPSVTPTVLRGGSAAQMNVIPGGAWLALDIRTVPGIEHDQLLHGLDNVVDEVSGTTGVEIGMTELDNRPPTNTPADHPAVRAVARAHKEVTTEDPILGGAPGVTDGTILWRDAGIPIVTYGPGDKWIPHQVDEFVAIDDIHRATRAYALAARYFLES